MKTGMMGRRVVLGLIGMLVVLMSGCYESTRPTLYEPGVYKGKDDPLRSKLESEGLHERLSERVGMAARDR